MKHFYSNLGITSLKTNDAVRSYGSSFGKVAIILILLSFFTSKVYAQTEGKSDGHQSSRQMAASMKYTEAVSSNSSFVATKDLENEINSVLKDIRVLLTESGAKTRFEAEFAPEMYRKGEQACPSVALKNLILGSNAFVATTISSDQELKHALGFLKKSIDFLDIK